jgi:hypothetical protein
MYNQFERPLDKDTFGRMERLLDQISEENINILRSANSQLRMRGNQEELYSRIEKPFRVPFAVAYLAGEFPMQPESLSGDESELVKTLLESPFTKRECCELAGIAFYAMEPNILQTSTPYSYYNILSRIMKRLYDKKADYSTLRDLMGRKRLFIRENGEPLIPTGEIR